MGIIYCARNKINGKLYIGKTNHTLANRRKKHEGMAGSSKYYFHNAIAKYGKDSFSWSIIDSESDESYLSELEQIYIDMFSSSIREHGYNSTHGGEGCSCNSETREKISISGRGKIRTPDMRIAQSDIKNEYYKNHIAYWYGKKRSNDTKTKISISKTGSRQSEHTKAKRSVALTGMVLTNRFYERFCKVCGIYFCSSGSRLEYCNKCNPNPPRSRAGAFIKET